MLVHTCTNCQGCFYCNSLQAAGTFRSAVLLQHSLDQFCLEDLKKLPTKTPTASHLKAHPMKHVRKLKPSIAFMGSSTHVPSCFKHVVPFQLVPLPHPPHKKTVRWAQQCIRQQQPSPMSCTAQQTSHDLAHACVHKTGPTTSQPEPRQHTHELQPADDDMDRHLQVHTGQLVHTPLPYTP
jgi:hypothetical protein